MNNLHRILHVDDDPSMTEYVAAQLAPYGCEVRAIHDPQEVIQNLPKIRERVVLLDIDMPRINGIELLKEIKNYDGSILVVMLTGVVTQSTVLQSLRYGAEACFFKPLEEFQPMAEALTDCFKKLNRWWNALDELVARRKATGSVFVNDGPVFQLHQ